MTIFNALIAFFYGAAIGSFLNVVILRLHEGRGVNGRSECPHCHHQLKALDLIPILSFIFLKGQCRYCHHKLSLQYPLVESVSAVAAVLVYLYSPFASPDTYGELIGLFFTLFFSAILLIVSVYDLRWGLIPDKIIVPASALALFYTFFANLFLFSPSSPTSALWSLSADLLTAVVVAFFFIALIVVTAGRGMGGGDLKLSVFIALFLGFPISIISFLLAFLTGALASSILLLVGKKGLKSTVPFGPFLALGAFIALLVGNDIWTAYLKALGF